MLAVSGPGAAAGSPRPQVISVVRDDVSAMQKKIFEDQDAMHEPSLADGMLRVEEFCHARPIGLATLAAWQPPRFSGREHRAARRTRALGIALLAPPQPCQSTAIKQLIPSTSLRAPSPEAGSTETSGRFSAGPRRCHGWGAYLVVRDVDAPSIREPVMRVLWLVRRERSAGSGCRVRPRARRAWC